jgi:hypothetical protein
MAGQKLEKIRGNQDDGLYDQIFWVMITVKPVLRGHLRDKEKVVL